MIESGHSSFEYLQNVYTSSDVAFQGLSLALCLAQLLLDGRGAWRVHGGGFGGTTQNFVPDDLLDSFRGDDGGRIWKGKLPLPDDPSLRRYLRGGLTFIPNNRKGRAPLWLN